MDVELVPFGNANVSYPRHDNKPVFHCQHGPKECYGNRVQACTIEMLKNTDLSIRFVRCMFDQHDYRETSQTSRRVCVFLFFLVFFFDSLVSFFNLFHFFFVFHNHTQ